MDQAAEDDAERARNRAELYAPPRGAYKRTSQDRPRPLAMTPAESHALAARLEAEDRQFSQPRAR